MKLLLRNDRPHCGWLLFKDRTEERAYHGMISWGLRAKFRCDYIIARTGWWRGCLNENNHNKKFFPIAHWNRTVEYGCSWVVVVWLALGFLGGGL